MVSRSKSELIQERWLIWSATVVLAVAATLSLSIWQRDLLLKAIEFKTERLIVLGFVALGAVAWLVSKGWSWLAATLDLNYVREHPPYWLASAIGVFAALFLLAEVDFIGDSLGFKKTDRSSVAEFSRYVSLMLLIAVVCIYVANKWLRKSVLSNSKARPERGPSASPGNYSHSPANKRGNLSAQCKEEASLGAHHVNILKDDVGRLVKWIQNDNPIEDDRQDLAGHRWVARRVVDRLMQAASDGHAVDMSQAIVGKFGSGKSSVLALAKREISKRGAHSLRIIDIPMWPYSTSRAAVVGVIESLITALSAEVNTISLRGVPVAYAEAIASAPGGRIALATLRPGVEHPANVLRSVDEVARVIGVHYVVWIEDLERFSAGADGEEKLEIVRSLLHGLHVLPSFTVVTASTDLSHRVDMDKIARFVERVSDFPAEAVQSICYVFIKEWREQAERAGCAELESWNEWHSTSEGMRYVESLMGRFPYDIPTSIASLLAVPRLLKRALRQCQEAWRVLVGEVDLAELLAICAIRESHPRVFSIIDSSIDILRDGTQEQINGSGSPLADVWRVLREEMARCSKVERDAMERLITEVFLRANKRARMQGFGTKLKHVDYWDRFNAQPDLPSTARDQYVLRVMRSSHVDTSLDVLDDENYGADAAAHLARLIPVERLVGLVIPLILRRVIDSRRRHDADANDMARVRGLGALRRVLLGHPDLASVNDKLVEALSSAISCCTEAYAFNVLCSLELLFFSVPTATLPGLVTNSKSVLLRHQVRRDLVAMCVDPGRVVDGLKSCSDWMLLRLIWGAELVEDSSYLDPQRQPFPEWPKLARVLLAALEQEPDVVAGSIALLVSSSTRFEPALCLARFGEKERVMQGIARGVAHKDSMRAIHASVVECLGEASSQQEVTENDLPQSLNADRVASTMVPVEIDGVSASLENHDSGNEPYTEKSSSLTPPDSGSAARDVGNEFASSEGHSSGERTASDGGSEEDEGVTKG